MSVIIVNLLSFVTNIYVDAVRNQFSNTSHISNFLICDVTMNCVSSFGFNPISGQARVVIGRFSLGVRYVWLIGLVASLRAY